MTNHRHDDLIDLTTKVKSSLLGLGTAPLGGLFSSVQESDSDDLINSALDNGIEFIDTAPLYGYGRAEMRIGRVISKKRRPLTLESKVGRVIRQVKSDKGLGSDKGLADFADAVPDVEPVFDFSKSAILESFEESLKRLQVESIDILLIHDADDHLKQAIDIAFPTLFELKQQGLIKAIGIGMNWVDNAAHMIRNTELDVALIAGRYTLIDQSAQDVLFPLALSKNVSIIAGGVFNSGVLANPVKGQTFNYAPAPQEIIQKAQKVKEYLAKRNIKITAAALQFPLRHSAVKMVLTGARHKNELLSNIEDFDQNLPQDLWQQMENDKIIDRMPN